MRDLPLPMVRPDHEALNRRADRLDEDDELWDLADRLAPRMLTTLKRQPGAALAAPQVGRSIALVVTAEGRVIADPEVELRPAAGTEVKAEGCLSLPNRWFAVERALEVVLRGYDVRQDLEVEELVTDAFQARLWQHECEHLDGLLLAGRYRELDPERL